MQTKPLYLDNSYQKTCSAKILDVQSDGKNKVIILDQTIFYPEGGGQPSDQGVIKNSSGTLKVEQVLLKDQNIVHIGKLEGKLEPDQEVKCEIDWDRRYKNMQVHSAGHVIHEAVKYLLPDSFPVEAKHGKNAYLKYQGQIEKTLEHRILEKANAIIHAKLPIFTEFVSLEELKKRSPWVPPHLPTNKPLRIMWIANFPPIPDGGTQLKNTEEIPGISEVNISHEAEDTLVNYKINSSTNKEKPVFSYSIQTKFDHTVLQNLKNEALAMIMGASDAGELERLRIQYLGKSGQLAEVAKQLKNLDPAQKAEIGVLFNDVKTAITDALGPSLKIKNLTAGRHDLTPKILKPDPTLPGIPRPLGHLHPVTQAITEISDIFAKIGFTRVRYPEVEWDWYAFGALNFPEGHPARDDWETFFVDAPADPKLGKMLLTPHTSSGQIREMETTRTPPIRMVNIAKCYRRQSDVSHTVMFHQFEGLVIDKGINITNLRGTIEYFVKSFFGPDRTSRLRPYHFQFTEPSFEVDISCGICNGRGCKLCKEGWLELGGSGLVHPAVLTAGGIDPAVYSGFAFGWGVERCYMMKSGTKIDDMRLLYDNDIRFLNQF